MIILSITGSLLYQDNESITNKVVQSISYITNSSSRVIFGERKAIDDNISLLEVKIFASSLDVCPATRSVAR